MGTTKNVAIWGEKSKIQVGSGSRYFFNYQSLYADLNVQLSDLQCRICQCIKHRGLPHLVKGQLACGQIWQIDYIGSINLR